jgi:HAD superfamily hydrolase (TIGR01458 family)
MQSIRSVLLDIDGVLHVSMQPIPGAAETLSWLEQHEYATYFVSNTTTMARSTLAHRLQSIGLPVTEHHVITAPVATANYIRQHFAGKRCWLLTKGDTARDFEGIELVEMGESADVVVIGGAEELLSYQAMNAAFRMVMAGASLLAMHTNMYWRTNTGLQLDSGPFIRALEIVTGQQAIIVGKPERAFFEQALRAISSSSEETIMVGDDIENDIGGAQRVGMRGVFVCTGKHTTDSPLLTRIQPDAILSSIADLPSWLEGHNHEE